MPIECRIGCRRTYGIAAVDATDGEKVILEALVDVTKSRRTAQILADRYNREQIPLDHLRDAVIRFVERVE